MRKVISILFLISIGFTAQSQEILKTEKLSSLDGIQVSLTGMSKEKIISYKDLLKNEKFILSGKNAQGFELTAYDITVVDGDKMVVINSSSASFDAIKKLMSAEENHDKVFVEHFQVLNVRENKKYLVKDQVIKITKSTK